MNVCVIDYGSGNLGSVCNILELLGAPYRLMDAPTEGSSFSHYILPGVGSFNVCMNNLEKSGWSEYIKTEVPKSQKPFLGICLGMQLLATKGYEDGETKGLDLIQGEVHKIEPNVNERIPHVGWNDVKFINENILTANILNQSDFYFVHSYYFKIKNPQNICGITRYCRQDIPAIVAYKNIYGVQFHPEKSSKSGIQLFKNFLKINCA